MKVDLESYKAKAIQSIEYVYAYEYHNSLGIPMPEVMMLLADDPNYSTGQYYITIDKTWQIHLNFGKLPVSYKEFEDEVKVLTRHEIEHYMCCPFDVITHLRMLKCIRDVYYKEFSDLNINIQRTCGSIANQAADIIVDTKNYYIHPKETLLSEINWIKKGGGLALCPRHNKLMFLTKEAIWESSLDINEMDRELISIAKELAKVFTKNGIDNKRTFLAKTQEYTRAFLKLYQLDKQDNSSNHKQGQQGIGDQQDGQQGQTSGQQDGQQSQSGMGNQHNGQNPNEPPQTPSTLRPKDGSESGSAFVFADPDKIQEAIEALAHETEVGEFVDILDIAGIGGLSTKEKEMMWFVAQSSDIIPIEEESTSGNPANYTYPSTWRIGDPVEKLDLMLSLMTSPMILPGITTKKWEKSTNEINGVERKQRDLFLVVDTSGSMKSVINKSDNMHQAALAAFGILKYFETKKSQVALITFSDRVNVDISWTRRYDEIRENLLVNGSGGTTFPIRKVQSILDMSKNDLVTVIITDGDLGNLGESVEYFREYLNDNNKLYIFLLGNCKSYSGYEKLKIIGAKVFQSMNAKDFCNMVLDDLN